MIQRRPWVLVGMISAAIMIRLIPYVLHVLGVNTDPATSNYPWNFSPLTAICLFGGTYFVDRRWAYFVPLAALVIGDIAMGLLMWDVKFAIHSTTPFVYGCFALTVFLASWVRKFNSWTTVAAAALLSECVFFIVTNFGQWMFGTGYDQNLQGLILCYGKAIPFFKHSVISTAIYGTAFFAGYAMLEGRVSAPLPEGVGTQVG